MGDVETKSSSSSSSLDSAIQVEKKNETREKKEMEVKGSINNTNVAKNDFISASSDDSRENI